MSDIFPNAEDAIEQFDGIMKKAGLKVKPVVNNGELADALFVDGFDEELDEILESMHRKGRINPNGYGEALDEAKQAIKQLIASELGAIIDANIDPDYAVDTDRVYEVLMEWMGELQGGGDE